MWLAAAALLAVIVAVQTIASAAGDRAAVHRRGRCAHGRTGCRRAGGHRRGAAAHPRLRLPPRGVRRRLDDDNDAPGGHNGCDTRNDILDRDLVDKTYVSIKRCPNAVATGTLHDPYTNATVAFVRGNQIGASVQIDHIVPLALAWDWAPGTGPTTCGCGSPTTRPT